MHLYYFKFQLFDTQMYAFSFLQSAYEDIIPLTKLLSYSQFIASGQQSGIKRYILQVLRDRPSGLTTRQISKVSGIEIGSLTNPILCLYKEGKIIRVGRSKNSTGRVAISYSLSRNEIGCQN